MADSTPKITTQILEIPTSLVLLTKSYQILIQIQNNSLISGNFKILYEGKGLHIKSSDLMNKEIFLAPNSSEIDHIEFLPAKKGLISLNIKVIYLKEVTPHKIKESRSWEIPQKIKGTIGKEIYSTSIYLNTLDKESFKLKAFAQKGDSNIITSGAGLPLCICYFYSDIQKDKWKIRPAIIRDACIKIKEKLGKFCFYLSYPLSKNFDEKEITIIQEAIKTFIIPHSLSLTPMLILNLDIIPELKKPSIIIGYEKSGIYEPVKKQIANIFGNSIDIFVDDCIFSGGLIYNYLVNWMGSSQIYVLNIILSNNFIKNIDIFQTLIESLASLNLRRL